MGIVTSTVFTGLYLPFGEVGFNEVNGLENQLRMAREPLLARCDNALPTPAGSKKRRRCAASARRFGFFGSQSATSLTASGRSIGSQRTPDFRRAIERAFGPLTAARSQTGPLFAQNGRPKKALLVRLRQVRLGSSGCAPPQPTQNSARKNERRFCIECPSPSRVRETSPNGLAATPCRDAHCRRDIATRTQCNSSACSIRPMCAASRWR